MQDATTLKHDGLPETSGRDDLGGDGKGISGILSRFGVAVSAAGRPLGMYAADADFCQTDDKDSVRWVHDLERAQELARACPDSRVVTVRDTEGDFLVLISRARAIGGNTVGAGQPRDAAPGEARRSTPRNDAALMQSRAVCGLSGRRKMARYSPSRPTLEAHDPETLCLCV